MRDLQTFAYQVEQMRQAQKQYFEQIAKAKKTKHPADFAAAGATLKTSKQLEEIVDRSVSEIKTSNG